jgi:putative ABC transport system permease protein
MNLTSLREAFAIAIRAIWSQKVRSILTTLGIVIGIVSVTSMGTVVNGLEKGFENDIATLGTDVVYIEKWPWTGVTDWWNYINRPNMTTSMGRDLERQSRYVTASAGVVSTGATVASPYHTVSGAPVQGVESGFATIHVVDLAEGYFFGQAEERSAMAVCIVGNALASSLFPNVNPLGKQIRVNGHRFQIIGVLERKGSGADSGTQEDNQITIPFSTFEKFFGTRYRDVSIHAKLVSAEVLDDARDEITGILRVSRRLDAKERDDFEINDQESLRAQVAPIKATIYTIGIGLTALSLLVGGIGVMNIMFVSVKERTREIGVRKAVGARSSNILTQFLIEAVIVCSIGGAIGILFAIPISLLVQAFLPASLDAMVVFIAFGICVLIGTVFGLAPAWTAAKSEPIQALRYE